VILFLIPARGGSKGLPGKNLAQVCGMPLVGRCAWIARNAGRLIERPFRVVCSTDDAHIAQAALDWGAEVPFVRPAALASDAAATADVVLHALDQIAGIQTVVLMQPTSPLCDPIDVAAAVRLHSVSGDPVVSVCATEHPSEWTFAIDEAGRLTRSGGPQPPHQRQETRSMVRPNGAVYVSDVESFRQARSFYRPETRGTQMPADRSIEIDQALELDLIRGLVAQRAPAPVRIRERLVGPGAPCFVIAEAGVNHNGDIATALALIDAAAAAAADAVKFQTFRTEHLVTRDAKKAAYQVRNTGQAGSQFDMLARLELSFEAHRTLMEHCRRRGILFLSSPFDEDSIGALESLDLAALKLPSGELTNLGFLRRAARSRRPLILSTGMADMIEVADAVGAIRSEHADELVLLHCVSSYPAVAEDANLTAMTTLREAFGVPVGFSDHTLGAVVPLAAVALGASVIEKHLTLDCNLPGPDHRASLEPAAFRDMVLQIRAVEAALGSGRKVPAASETAVASAARKSVVAVCDIAAGASLEPHMLAVRRPGTGLRPSQLDGLIGRIAAVDIPSGTPLTHEMLA